MARKNHYIIDGLFGFEGRFRRSEYWIAGIGLSLVRILALLTICGVLGVSMIEASRMAPVRLGLDLLFLWPMAAINIKRGHDRNRSTLFTGLLLASIYGASAVITALASYGNDVAVFGLSLLVLPVYLYMFIDYALIDGTKGPNRYGLSPKGAQGEGKASSALILE